MMVSEPPLHVPGGAEEAFGSLQRIAVDATRQDFPRGGYNRVVRAREPRDGIEQDHDVLPVCSTRRLPISMTQFSATCT